MKERKNFFKMAHLTDKHYGKHDISDLYMWSHEIGPKPNLHKKIYKKKRTTKLFYMQIQSEKEKKFFLYVWAMNIMENWYEGTTLMKL